ncbi:MAG: hypothetical protein CM15mV97_130 [Caudoviricetes sp.]|nr:MAG: hypothetical protein CM15mV97_130 [Caudoviricetes sp.]
MCSVATGQCPSSSVPSSSVSGWQFNSHYDCINAGYGVAQKTFHQNLSELEEWDTDYINQNKIVVKFECREVGTKI